MAARETSQEGLLLQARRFSEQGCGQGGDLNPGGRTPGGYPCAPGMAAKAGPWQAPPASPKSLAPVLRLAWPRARAFLIRSAG